MLTLLTGGEGGPPPGKRAFDAPTPQRVIFVRTTYAGGVKHTTPPWEKTPKVIVPPPPQKKFTRGENVGPNHPGPLF